MQRREFIEKCGAGLAGIIAAGKAPATVVKSLLGGYGVDRSGMTNEPFINPYVSDGLVAMWDGEWNAGLGIHDQNATIWKEITNSGRDWTLNTAKCYFGENFININGKCGTGEWVVPNNERTTEVVFSCPSNPKNGKAMICECNCVNNRPRMQIAIIKVDNQWKVGFNGYYYQGGLCNDILNLHSYSINAANAFQDGISNSIVNSSSWGGGSKGKSFLGGDYGNTVYEFVGQVYCIRYYNRYLTESEIQHNYAIDRERFGL